MASDIQTKTVSSDPKDIARAELARWRRRLGPLTHEQEVRIEKLVVLTATKVSLLGGRVMESLLDCSERNLTIELPTSSTAKIIGAVPETA